MEERRRRMQAGAYVDGNTVRKMEAAPDYRREQEEKRQRELRRHKEYVARRNREHAMRMNLRYVLFLTAATILTAFVATSYIRLQAEVTDRMKRIASLQSEVAGLRADNDAMQKRISTSVDLEQVKNTAIEQLGMVYATPDQIVYYSVDDDDYMNQYSEIPQR